MMMAHCPIAYCPLQYSCISQRQWLLTSLPLGVIDNAKMLSNRIIDTTHNTHHITSVWNFSSDSLSLSLFPFADCEVELEFEFECSKFEFELPNNHHRQEDDNKQAKRWCDVWWSSSRSLRQVVCPIVYDIRWVCSIRLSRQFLLYEIDEYGCVN